jgi:hypothetical protein
MPKSYYVVNAGHGRSTHIMYSRTPSTPNPRSLDSVVAQLLWFGGNAKPTLCGLAATRHVNVFTPAEASCRECRRRWELATSRTATARTATARTATARTATGKTITGAQLAATTAAVRRDPDRPDSEIARETGVTVSTVMTSRATLEDSGELPRSGRVSEDAARLAREASAELNRGIWDSWCAIPIVRDPAFRVRDAMRRDPYRPDSEIAREAGTSESMAGSAREVLAGMGEIPHVLQAAAGTRPAGQPPVITGDQALAALNTPWPAASRPCRA